MAGEETGMIGMRCPYCGGRGWQWVGVASNAYRQECEACGGKGRGHVEWARLAGLTLVLATFAATVWLIVWATTHALP